MQLSLNNKVFIYCLSDPETLEIRYIGKSVDYKRRFKDHITRSKNGKSHKDKWVNSVLIRGLKPILKIIEECNTENWSKREIFYIDFYKKQGFKLVNGTDGGENGGSKHTIESKRKISLAKIGNKNSFGAKRSEETKFKIGCQWRGKQLPIEMKKKISGSMTGIRLTEDHIKKISISNTGKKRSKETIEKYKEAWVKRKARFAIIN